MKAKPEPYVDERDCRILYERGYTLAKIAKDQRCTAARVARVLVPILEGQGLDQYQIVERLGAHTVTVQRVAKPAAPERVFPPARGPAWGPQGPLPRRRVGQSLVGLRLGI